MGEFSGGTKPAFKSDDRSNEENMQEAKLQKANKRAAQDRDIEAHIKSSAEAFDFA
jgi:hypothetical protein